MKKNYSNKATASMVLGIIGLFAWLIPIVGAPVNIVGLILGIMSLKSDKRNFAIAGSVMCTIGIILTIISVFYGLISAVSYYSTI